MNSCKRFLPRPALSAIAIGLAFLVLGWSTTASAQEPTPRERPRAVATLFGLQTLSPNQTALLTVVNPAAIIPCVRVRLTFDVYESSPSEPTRLRFVRSVSREAELEPGEAASFDFTAGARGAFVSPASLAIEEIEVGDPHSPGRVVETERTTSIRTRTIAAPSTLVITEKGRVVFTAPGVRVGFDPQPDPPANA